jgi:hypothetical protein
MSIKNCLLVLLAIVCIKNTKAQGPPSTGNASAAARSEATQVNYYTGIPSISVPIYSYGHHSGLGLGISLDYYAGGLKHNSVGSTGGYGWNLSGGGVITRTVRGLPDDYPWFGFLQAPVIPTDPRNLVYEYYYQCRDAEQDVFQFSFGGRSGKFYMGKDSSIYVTSLSKMRIQCSRRFVDDDGVIYTEPKEPRERGPVAQTFGTINSFTITTEDGMKYFFAEKESDKMLVNSCNPYIQGTTLKYAIAWYLTKITTPQSNDSIKISYTSTSNGSAAGYDFTRQNVSIVNGVTAHSDTSNMTNPPDLFISGVSNKTGNRVPYEFIFPDNKKVQIIYNDRIGNTMVAGARIERIKIMDSVFRYGYMFNWNTDTTLSLTNTSNFIKDIKYYTSNTMKDGYKFDYDYLYVSDAVQKDTMRPFQNKVDHWGYYNGANNSKDFVPTVAGLYTGANREANALVVKNTLKSIEDPAGGITYYDFENNDVYPVQHTKQTINIAAATNTQTNIALARVQGAQTYFKVKLDLAPTSIGVMPITGAGHLIFTVTNLAGTTTLSTDTINLQDLYYSGIATFKCTVPTGSYLLKSTIAAGTTCSIALPLKITWYNQAETAATSILTGGIRIKQVRRYDPFSNKTDTVSTYKYVTATGKSAGFIGTTPVYHYEFASTPSNKIKIISEDVNDLDYSEGSAIGYNRVEVYNGSVAKNLGKQVYEYTSVLDYAYDNSPSEFPYLLVKRKEWVLGLPKKVSTYDNAGVLIQTTKNVFSTVNTSVEGNESHRSLKIGQVGDIANMNNNNENFKNFLWTKNYPEAGRVNLIASLDTFFHPNGSVTTDKKEITYDSNYNVIKIVTPYDINRNLNVEKRMYYPYNYTVAGGIGKLRDSGIFVPVSTETWIIGDATPRVLSISASDFEDLSLFALSSIKLTKNPTKTYALLSNKPVLQAQIGLFNPAILIRDTNWIKQQQAMVYDKKGKLVQTTSLPANMSSSIIYGYKNTKPIAQVSNAKITDIAYTSFEPESEGAWQITGAGYDSTTAITGRYSYNLTNNQIQKGGLDAAKIYIVTYWTKGNAYILSVANSTAILEQRFGWSLYTQTFTGLTNITIAGNGNIDELRLHPQDANMTTTCYEPFGETNSTCDANNNIVYYEYDAIKRIKLLKDKDKNIVKKYDYSDAYQVVNLNPSWLPTTPANNKCERDSIGNYTGNVLRTEIDLNPLSESFGAIRYMFDHVDFLACPMPVNFCNDPLIPWQKNINSVCETGCKVTTASVYKKVNIAGVLQFKWVCTYHYVFSDASVTIDYEEIGDVSCPLGNACNLGNPA